LGWLDESEVPEVPELAMIIVYRAGNIKEHRFIVGGKSSEHQLDLKNLYDLCPGLTPVDSTKPLEGSVKINFTTLVFQPGRKTTPWVPIQAMFKGSLAWHTTRLVEDLLVHPLQVAGVPGQARLVGTVSQSKHRGIATAVCTRVVQARAAQEVRVVLHSVHQPHLCSSPIYESSDNQGSLHNTFSGSAGRSSDPYTH
jgi:hypothetical protein